MAFLVAAPAAAQIGEGLVVQPQIPQNSDRGRNLSVEEQPRPDYSPLGARFGSVIFYPRIETGAGGTSNTYLRDTGAVSSPFLYIRPSARLVSDWSRHTLQLSGTATLRNYLGESARNERLWSVDALGRLDVRSTLAVEGTASISQVFENQFSGEVASSVAALSRFRRDFGSVQATYTNGRGRGFVTADYTSLRFRPVALIGGGVRDQTDRNREVTRLTGQLEYARSPSVSLFGQLSGSQTDYERNLRTGDPNLDSKAVRLLVGANVDIAGRIRGTFGLGYSIRDYDAAVYDTVRGLSIESRLQVFPLRRLTVTLAGERTIEDASQARVPFWSTRFNLRGDYEVLRNLIINANADYSRQTYRGIPLSSSVYRAEVGGRYLASRRVVLRGSLNYSHRSSNDPQVLAGANEARVEAGIAYQL